MDLPQLAIWARRKGINLLGTGDFTHPLWYKTLRQSLIPQGNGLYCYDQVLFMLTAEISCIWSQQSRLRKIHLLLFSPSLQDVERINCELVKVGNLAADGRPILSISAIKAVEIILSVSPQTVVIPAHAWTPWFSVFGAKSGFDSLAECFGSVTNHIFAIETGLSSDPPMNWRLSSLDRISLISNSDAHSPANLGREANLFDLPEASFGNIITAIKEKDQTQFIYTIEFFPAQGKYHYDGHRNCGRRFAPQETIMMGNICPVCGKELTIGVMHRVEALADRTEAEVAKGGIPFIIPYRSLIPLQEIIAQALKVEVTAKQVEKEYLRLIEYYGNELRILLDLAAEELTAAVPLAIQHGILQVRCGNVKLLPGYDGVYGTVQITPAETRYRQRALIDDRSLEEIL
jgi:uncharacterized protein (TIGR00375 family)